MEDQDKSKEQLINELATLRRQVAAPKAPDTDRKQIMENLWEKEGRFRTICEKARAGMVATDMDGNFLEVNPAFCNFLGRSKDELLKLRVIDVTFPEDLAETRRQFEEIKAGLRQTIDLEKRYVRKDGAAVWGHVATVCISDSDLKPIYSIAIIQDITERKRAENALLESEARYKRLIDSVTDYIYTVQIEDGRPVATSHGPGCLAVTGYTSDEYQADPYLWYRIVHAQDRGAVTEQAARVSAGETTTPLEHRIVHRNGSIRWVRNTSVPHYDEHRRLVAYDGLITNITERKEAEATAKRLAHEDSVLAEIGRIISSTLKIEEVYKSFTEKVRELIRFDRIAIGLINADENTVMFPYIEGTVVPGRGAGDVVPLVGSTAEQMLQTHAGMISAMEREGEIAARIPGLLPEFRSGIRSALTVPLISGDRVIGTLALRSTIPGIYTERDLRLVESIGSQIAGAIANAQLYSRLSEAEESLRRSERKFRDLYDNAPVGYHELDKEGRITNVNRADLEMLGYSREEVIGEYIWKFNENEDIVRKSVLEKLSGIRPPGWSFERTYRRKNGATLPILLKDLLNRDEQGRITGIRVTVQDITEQKRTEGALRESEEALRVFLNANPESSLLIDAKGTIFIANESLSKRLGKNLDEMIGSCLYDLLPEDVVNQRKPHFDEVFQTGESLRFEDMRMDKYYETFVNPVFDTEGNVTKVAIVGFDVTERKRAETALMETQGRLKRAQTIGHLGNWEIDLLTRKVWASEEAFRIYGIDWGDEFLPLELVQQCVLPEYRLKMDEALRQLISENREYDLQFQIKRINDGGIRFLNSKAERILDKDGRIVKVAGVVQDITERKRAEEEKAKLEVQLQQAQKMESVGRLAGGVAHDFNNKLAIIMGYAEMALNEVDPGEKLHRQLEQILEAGHRSADLTRQLLAFARKQTVSPKVLDLNDTVSGMLKMLRRLIGEDINLVWNPGGKLWRLKIDPSQIDQILANLAVNARDAIPATGSVTLKTENVVLNESYCADHPGCNPGEYVLLKVIDTGSGMSKEVLEHIFEPFFTTKGVGKGTGLGLSTVYGIVKQNDGFIEVSSEPGKGTTFKIYLPQFQGETIESIKETEETPEGTETILLVEDDEPVLNLSKVILESLGYTVLAAQTPEQAIRLIETHDRDIHLLITDVVMPEMNGRELAEQIAAIKPGLKCLYISGYTADVIARQGVLDEGVHFIQKPFKKSEIAKKVREVLSTMTL